MIKDIISVFLVLMLFSVIFYYFFIIYKKRKIKFINSLGLPDKSFNVTGKYNWFSKKEHSLSINFHTNYIVIKSKKAQYFPYTYACSLEIKKSQVNWFVLYWSTNIGIVRIYFKTDNIKDIKELLTTRCSLIKIKI